MSEDAKEGKYIVMYAGMFFLFLGVFIFFAAGGADEISEWKYKKFRPDFNYVELCEQGDYVNAHVMLNEMRVDAETAPTYDMERFAQDEYRKAQYYVYKSEMTGLLETNERLNILKAMQLAKDSENENVMKAFLELCDIYSLQEYKEQADAIFGLKKENSDSEDGE